MQTILGSSGVIGKGLAKVLPNHCDDIRLVSRNPIQVNKTDQLFKANLLSGPNTIEAIEGSEIVYLAVGLPYKLRTWTDQWPVIMKNVIEACKIHKSKLVFFDNVYPYGNVKGWMTEETPYNPCSKKGKVRANISQMVMDAVEKGDVEAVIARAADFYGPGTPLSFFNVMVIVNMIKGKKPQLMMSDRFKHSLAYTPDQSEATALIGNTPQAYNQIWHLPTDHNALSGKELIELCAEKIGKENKVSITILNKWMIRMAGLFNHNIKETVEMLYQYNSDYLFDSTKFDNAFSFNKVTYAKGIEQTIRYYLDQPSF